jgi:hypothetical protein
MVDKETKLIKIPNQSSSFLRRQISVSMEGRQISASIPMTYKAALLSSCHKRQYIITQNTQCLLGNLNFAQSKPRSRSPLGSTDQVCAMPSIRRHKSPSCPPSVCDSDTGACISHIQIHATPEPIASKSIPPAVPKLVITHHSLRRTKINPAMLQPHHN